MSSFPGMNQHRVSGFRMSRRFTNANQAAFKEINFRSGSWFGADDKLNSAQRAAAVARGEVKLVTVTADAGAVDLSDVLAPTINQFTRADSATTFPSASRSFNNQDAQSVIYWRTVGATTFELEVEYDIPAADEV